MSFLEKFGSKKGTAHRPFPTNRLELSYFKTAPQPVKKPIFDRLTEIKEAPKTNNSNPSAYIGTVGFELCSKSKCLA